MHVSVLISWQARSKQHHECLFILASTGFVWYHLHQFGLSSEAEGKTYFCFRTTVTNILFSLVSVRRTPIRFSCCALETPERTWGWACRLQSTQAGNRRKWKARASQEEMHRDKYQLHQWHKLRFLKQEINVHQTVEINHRSSWKSAQMKRGISEAFLASFLNTWVIVKWKENTNSCGWSAQGYPQNNSMLRPL